MFRAVVLAWRSWAKARSVAALAILAFAVGIGSATALYTIINGVLLKPVPYREGDRFVAIYSAATNEPNQRGAHIFPNLIEYERRTRAFDVFGWFKTSGFTLTFDGQPQHVVGVAVTPSLAHNLGVPPTVGQWFSDDTGVMISHALWQRLGADPDIVGKPLRLDERALTIAGVMPPWFRLPAPGPGLESIAPDVWLSLDPLGKGQNPAEGMNFAYARRKPGVTLQQAEDDVKRVAAEIAKANPAIPSTYTALVDDLRQNIILEIRPTLVLLALAAAVLLLITCADVAGLLLSRAVARARETAIRVALGAGRRQLAVQYFLESLVISALGATAGIVVSVLLVRGAIAVAGDRIPRAEEIRLDWSVFLFAAAIAALAAGLASLAPLWQALRTMPSDALTDGVRSTASARSRRVSKTLVVAELALAFALLAVSAVLVDHLRGLGRVAPGFNPSHLLTFQLDSRPAGDTADARSAAHARYTSAVEAIPGVTSAAFANHLPLAGCCFSTTIYAEGVVVPPANVQRTVFIAATPGYFRTLEIPLKTGRLIDERDLKVEPLPVVINEAAARATWPGRDPIGAFGRVGAPDGSRFQIVGVVGDVKNDGLNKPTVPEIYLLSSIVSLNPLRFVVRSPLPPESLVPQIRTALASVDPTRAIHHVETMSGLIERSVAVTRISSLMVSFFACAALLMATLGVYGVVSYAVRQGTVEIGTRLALGAVDRDLLFMIVASGLRMAALGTAVGFAGAIGASWLLARSFQIPELGIAPFALSTLIVGSVAAIAAFVPAWRAISLSPMVAIRNQPGTMERGSRQSVKEMLRSLFRTRVDQNDVRRTQEDLVIEFTSAARAASSFPEAFRLALDTLRHRLGASWVTLLERSADVYVRRSSSPAPIEGADAELTLPAEGFLVRRLLAYSRPLPLRRTDLDGWLQWARDAAPHYVAELESLSAHGARVALGVRAKNDVIGVLILGAPNDHADYTANERSVLHQCAEQLALMIENARLTTRIVEQEKLRRDVALAAEVQRRLLPERPPERETAALAAVSLPARTVGGDYYDFLDLGDHRVGIALADIAGKGVAAALIMAVVQASLRIVSAERNVSLPELAARINGFLHRSTRSNSYATFFYAQLDEVSRQLRYVNAGHNPPYLVRAGTVGAGSPSPQIFELNIGGTVLGLFPEMTYEEASIDLQPGDVLVAFTDGVTEALNAGEEEFGEERLKTLLREVVHLPAAEISARIANALRSWIAETAQYDDLTFVVMKVN